MVHKSVDIKEKNLDWKGDSEREDHFFIPDLCAIQPVFFLVLISELMSVVIVLASGSLERFDWTHLALVSFYVQWISLSSAALLCQTRRFLKRLPNHWAAIIGYCLILLDVAVFSALGQWVMGQATSNPWVQTTFFSALNWLDIARDVIIAAIIGGMVLRYFYLQEQLTQQLRSELTHRLQALQSRIRPHFLFNSMNIIASLIETEPETAETVVEDLSELFRASLNEVGNQVSFAQEVALCERYIRIEKLRLGNRLEVEWALDSVPSSVKIPLLTLQPLVENAIYHGIQPLPKGGTIGIVGSCNGESVEFTVVNPMPSEVQQMASTLKHKGNRMALDNIRHRLVALYGNKASLQVEKSEQRYRVTVKYPLVKTTKEVANENHRR